MIIELLSSPYLIAIGVAWLSAHVVKYLVAPRRGSKLNITHQLFLSGGMPSSHATTTLAVWVVVLLKDGADSGLFGLATLITLIICYDAVKVRRSSGEQGESLRALIKEQKSKVTMPRVAKGHTPKEVLAGAALGIIIGCIVFLATR